MLNDPSQTTQGQQARTALFLPAPSPQHTNGTIASTPLLVTARGRQNVQLPLALAMLSLVATTALVLGILFAVVPLLAQSRHSSNTTPKQIPTLTASTPPAADVTPSPIVQGTTTINGLSILPTHFTVQSDCQPDNGYRCTETLYASQDIQNDIQWQAFSDSLNARFSPQSGTIEQGQQQQVIVYIYDACPYTGTLVFSLGDNNLTVPVSC